MKKSILFTLLTTALLGISGSFFYNPVKALDTQNNPYDSYCRTPHLEQFGDIDRSQAVIINGIENPLYCTFVDSEAALAKLREIAPDVLLEIANTFSFSELNNENWKDYKYAAKNLPENSEFWSETNEQAKILSEFFDIYEDTERNELIMQYLTRPENSGHRIISQNQKTAIGMLLPTYAPLAQESNKNIKANLIAANYSLPNINAAITYAETYAVNPNEAGYGLARGGIFGLIVMDCTNFASQILEASGVSQVVYDSDTMGWWHKNINGGHTYSASWINSDIFARYMGVGYSTTNHYDFSYNITKGDFITYDETNNGSWDHIGFVTDTGIELCYLDGTYRNYKVAQHTRNYHEWASSDNNGWPTVAQKYGRVRR